MRAASCEVCVCSPGQLEGGRVSPTVRPVLLIHSWTPVLLCGARGPRAALLCPDSFFFFLSSSAPHSEISTATHGLTSIFCPSNQDKASCSLQSCGYCAAVAMWNEQRSISALCDVAPTAFWTFIASLTSPDHVIISLHLESDHALFILSSYFSKVCADGILTTG